MNFTIDELYAMQGIILGLEGLTRTICKDFNVDNLELLKKLEKITDKQLKKASPT